MKLIASLAAGRVDAAADSAGGPAAWIETDPDTGRQHLKLPLPEPAAVRRVADALQGLLAGWRG